MSLCSPSSNLKQVAGFAHFLIGFALVPRIGSQQSLASLLVNLPLPAAVPVSGGGVSAAPSGLVRPVGLIATADLVLVAP